MRLEYQTAPAQADAVMMRAAMTRLGFMCPGQELNLHVCVVPFRAGRAGVACGLPALAVAVMP